jgi:hypothetical protein
MDEKQILEEIKNKRDFSKLPNSDILMAYKKFERRQCSDEEKIRLTRDLLRKIYSAFVSEKLLSVKDKDEEWFLRKHLSTCERANSYFKLYEKLLNKIDEKEISIIDLGAGINGFSYKSFPKNIKLNYIAVEAIGQLVDLINFYFEKNKLNGKAIHESLFELEKIKEIIEKCKKPRILFLFKVIDSLEMLEDNYSKTFLQEITPLANKIVVSFATRSMLKKEKFKVNRKWIVDFIKENFELLDDFELNGERYIVFKSKL